MERFGWSREWADLFAPLAAQGFEPARVATEHRGSYTVVAADGEHRAAVTGRLRREASAPSDFPAVGDWVALERDRERDRLHAVLPRRTAFVRQAAGRVEEQVVAANVDTVFVVAGLDGELDLRRLERYLAAVYEGGAEPAIVLTKLDLGAGAPLDEVARVAPDVPVHAVSNRTGAGIDELRPYFLPNRTVAALGSSGVGKSSLVNSLAGREEAATGAVGRGGGRHTTRRRQLIPMPEGGVFLDTPGMRRLVLWEAEEGLEAAFPEIAVLAERCRFSDCSHGSEPGCAVGAAVDGGELERVRLDSYLAMRDELSQLRARR